MAKDVAFKLNLPGLNELMKSMAMGKVLDKAARQIAKNAGDGFEVEEAHAINFVGIAAVHAATPEAVRKNKEDNTLLKAAGGTRI